MVHFFFTLERKFLKFGFKNFGKYTENWNTDYQILIAEVFKYLQKYWYQKLGEKILKYWIPNEIFCTESTSDCMYSLCIFLFQT